jgi:hypothetical protein
MAMPSNSNHCICVCNDIFQETIAIYRAMMLLSGLTPMLRNTVGIGSFEWSATYQITMLLSAL